MYVLFANSFRSPGLPMPSEKGTTQMDEVVLPESHIGSWT
jgi:hypothetical protein